MNNSFGVKLLELGALLRTSNAQWIAHSQNQTLMMLGHLIIALKSVALASNITVLLLRSATQFW